MQNFLCNLKYILLSLCFIVCTYSHAKNDTSKNHELNQVKKAIAQQQNQIELTTQQRQRLEKKLQQDDIAIAASAKQLNIIAKDLITTDKQLQKLAQKKQTLTAEKNTQERLLATQLRTAYTSGQHDYLKLLLNQEEPSKIQRSLTYYQYLNNARIKEIETFKKTISQLLEVVTQHQEKSEKLASLQIKQQQQKQSIEVNKKQRNQSIALLNKQLSSSKQQLSQLVEQEQNLTRAIEQLKILAKKNTKLTGLSKLKGKLEWPIKGRMLHRFGTRKQGYLKWKGALLSAPVGREVNNIYRGTILFADWLKGYGLVTVVDHGAGYMSLYGHNQTLLKNVGERVEAGETIALVGQSGGQNNSGLYFEIRYKGQAVNPTSWCH